MLIKLVFVFDSVALWTIQICDIMLFLQSDLEKEVESFKQQSKNSKNSSDDSTLIQVCLQGSVSSCVCYKYSHVNMLYILHHANHHVSVIL